MAPWGRFADLLEYPGADRAARVRACGELPLAAQAAEALRRFEAAAEGSGRARLEEEYAAAFDLDGSCALYAGHHLFGEDARRNRLLCGLAAEYRRAGFPSPAGELPDYLPMLLRYLEGGSARAGAASDEVRRELLAEVVLPACRKLEAALAGRGHPYAPLLRALVLTLEAATGPGDRRPEACAEGATA